MDRTRPVSAQSLTSRQTPLRAIERLEQAESPRINVQRVMLSLFSIAVIAAAGVGMHYAVDSMRSRRIETVHIDGTLTFVTEDQIKQTVGAEASTSLVAVDLPTIKEKLEALPWIRVAEVRRQWPDTLNIRVEEEIAIARWGRDELLNQQGQVFRPDAIDDGLTLPLLAGPLHSEARVMRQYQEFNQLLYPLGVRIRDLTLNESGSFELTLTNGVLVKLGREEMLDRLRRLVVFLESEYGSDLQNVESIDLRYRNGFAVARKRDLSGDVDGQLPRSDQVGQLPMRQSTQEQQHG